MKIAILTLPLHANYGGVMQNYALQTVLERMGHEVHTINITIPEARLKMPLAPLFIIKRLLMKLLGRKDGIIFMERKLNHDKPIIEQHVRRFISENIHLTKAFSSKESLKEINDMRFDAVVVGSDQVWRIEYAYPDIQTYFLDFITDSNIRKLAYSASFGTDEMEFSKRQARECGNLIKDFDFISVREDSAIDLIMNRYKWQCKNKPVHTLDPTMLLTREDYTALSSGCDDAPDGELFYYILDMTDDKRKVLDILSRNLGYKPFTVKSKDEDIYANPNDRIVSPVEHWLESFRKAKYVFTDSFHGCVFSIIFNKEFIVYGNRGRGMSRFSSLLNDFSGLSSRIVYSSGDYNKGLTDNRIDWEMVNSKLEEKREEDLLSFCHLIWIRT